MNTIDLLDKLNLPTKIGLDEHDVLLNKKTIMDAYLSAASMQFNRQLYSNDCLFNTGNFELESFSFANMCTDLVKSPSFDLFKMIGSSGDSFNNDESSDTKIVLDLSQADYAPQSYQVMPGLVQDKCQETSQIHDLADTESESFTKLENEHQQKRKIRRTKSKRSDKGDINDLINDERRRLLAKLDSCESDRIVFKRRVKNNKKDLSANADTYRGSKFWGVSKNKSKWQVNNKLIFSLSLT